MTQIWIDARSPHTFERIYSITLLERILRQLFELGVRHNVTVLLRPDVDCHEVLRKDFWPRYTLAFDSMHTAAPFADLVTTAADATEPLILLEGDGIYDERILAALLTSSTSLYIYDEHQPRAPLAIVIHPTDQHYIHSAIACLSTFCQQARQQGWLPSLSIYQMESYIPDLRQYAVPFLLRLERPEAIQGIENAMYEKTFKGVMDFIATYIYRLPVRGLVRLLAPTRITPNAVTAMSVLCSFAAIPLFAAGWIWTAFLVAYTFVICDSLDGKLARMTIRLSKRAGQIDHGTSTPFEACYYLAWTWHFSGGHLTTWPAVAGMLLFGFFCLDKITTGTFSRIFHRSLFDYHLWDARFHLIAGRRTINLTIMAVGYALQAPITALVITMVWMGVTMGWHMSRFAWHAHAGL